MTDKITIYDREIAGTRTVLEVYRDDDGDLVVAGQDLGEAPLRWLGTDEYEYWITVPSSHALQVSIDRLRDLARTSNGSTTPITEWLDKQGIPHEFFSWSSGF
jgi:hypothetical protein